MKIILILGDANFSFSVAVHKLCIKDPLSTFYGSILYATTFEDATTCISKYGNITTNNKKILLEYGHQVFHDVDATNLEKTFSNLIFHRIIFNFPHIGRKAGIDKNRLLLKNFFISAKKFTNQDSKVDVSLCAGQGGTPSDTKIRKPCNSWKIVKMASFGGFILTSVDLFQNNDYPPYECTGKRGSSKSFHLQGSITHQFTQSQFQILLFTKNWFPKVFQSSSPTYFTMAQMFIDHLITSSQNASQNISLKRERSFISWSFKQDETPESADLLELRYFIDRRSSTCSSDRDDFFIFLSGCNFDIKNIKSFFGKQVQKVKWKNNVENKDDSEMNLDEDKDDLVTVKRGKNFITLSLNLQKLASKASHKLDSKNLHFLNPKYESLHPPQYIFHISFWIIDELTDSTKYIYSFSHFLQITSFVFGDLISSIKLLEKYVDEYHQRTSYCFEISVQSDDFALSCKDVRTLEEIFRRTLSKHLYITLR